MAEVSTPEQLAQAVAAAKYFRLDVLADLVEQVGRVSLDEADALYQARWDSWNDGELTPAFERRLAESPGDFDPLVDDEDA